MYSSWIWISKLSFSFPAIYTASLQKRPLNPNQNVKHTTSSQCSNLDVIQLTSSDCKVYRIISSWHLKGISTHSPRKLSKICLSPLKPYDENLIARSSNPTWLLTNVSGLGLKRPASCSVLPHLGRTRDSAVHHRKSPDSVKLLLFKTARKADDNFSVASFCCSNVW